MESGNEEGVLTQSAKANKCHGVQQKPCFQHDTLTPERPGISSLEEGDGLKLQAEDKQRAGTPSEEQG